MKKNSSIGDMKEQHALICKSAAAASIESFSTYVTRGRLRRADCGLTVEHIRTAFATENQLVGPQLADRRYLSPRMYRQSSRPFWASREHVFQRLFNSGSAVSQGVHGPSLLLRNQSCLLDGVVVEVADFALGPGRVRGLNPRA